MSQGELNTLKVRPTTLVSDKGSKSTHDPCQRRFIKHIKDGVETNQRSVCVTHHGTSYKDPLDTFQKLQGRHT